MSPAHVRREDVIWADRIVDGYIALGVIALSRAPMAFLSLEHRSTYKLSENLVKALPVALTLEAAGRALSTTPTPEKSCHEEECPSHKQEES